MAWRTPIFRQTISACTIIQSSSLLTPESFLTKRITVASMLMVINQRACVSAQGWTRAGRMEILSLFSVIITFCHTDLQTQRSAPLYRVNMIHEIHHSGRSKRCIAPTNADRFWVGKRVGCCKSGTSNRRVSKRCMFIAPTLANSRRRWAAVKHQFTLCTGMRAWRYWLQPEHVLNLEIHL